MRARMAMAYSKISYEHREILLRDRPKSLYDLSKKGTVPVLQLMDGTVIDESIDIMKWCIQQNDLNGWYKNECTLQDNMIKNNDNEFKYWLDRYKYHVRYEENSYEAYQNNVKNFFSQYLCEMGLTDTSGPKKYKRSNWFFWVFKTCSISLYRFYNFLNSFVLTYNTFFNYRCKF